MAGMQPHKLRFCILVYVLAMGCFAELYPQDDAMQLHKEQGRSPESQQEREATKADQENRNGKESWLGKDKFQHFAGSALLMAGSFLTFREALHRSEPASLATGGTLTFAVGAGKELHDKNSETGHASVKDLVADVAGIAFTMIIIAAF